MAYENLPENDYQAEPTGSHYADEDSQYPSYKIGVRITEGPFKGTVKDASLSLDGDRMDKSIKILRKLGWDGVSFEDMTIDTSRKLVIHVKHKIKGDRTYEQVFINRVTAPVSPKLIRDINAAARALDPSLPPAPTVGEQQVESDESLPF